MFHPSLIWIECPNDVESGWTYNGSSFSEPTAPVLTEEQHYAACETALHSYIYARYPLPTQSSLHAISVDAVINGWTDITGYLTDIWSKISSCLALFYAHCNNPELGVPDYSTVSWDGTKTLGELLNIIAGK